MANKNSSDATQRSKTLKKGLAHQNYRRQMEAEELKQEILLRLEKDAKKEEKRLAKIAKDRQEVEHLKQESLIEQVPIILNEKKKSKHGKTEVQNGQASAEPKVDGHISVENNDIARSGCGDKHDNGMWDDDDIWDESYSNVPSVSVPDEIWDESSSNVPTVSVPDEIWDETSVTKQTGQMSRFNQGNARQQSQKYKSERTFYSSNNNNYGCKSKDRTGPNEFQRNGRNNSYKDNRRNNSKRKEDRQFQKRNSSAHYSERHESRSNSESAWDEPKQSFRPASGKVDAPLPEVNVWAQRQSKMEELEQLKPHNDFEEEAMLLQALELSRRQAIEDEKRRKELQEEYCTQLNYLSKNPDLAAELEAIEESGATAATPSTYSKNDNYSWDDDKSQHESDDAVMYHNSRKAQHSYNRSNYNLECSYEMRDVCGTDENSQKQHEYKGARPKYKQTVISQESWNTPATTCENNVQYDNDDDGIWGDVDGPSDNIGKCSEDVVEAKEDHSEVEEESAQTEQELNTVCNRVLNLSLVANKANSQSGYEEKHKSESLCNSPSNESVCDGSGGDSSGNLNIHAKIVQNEDKEHKISSFQDYSSLSTPFDNKLSYTSEKTVNNEECKRNAYLVKETSFFEDKHDSKNSNFVKDKEQDLWNDELGHLLNSVKGIPLSSEMKFNTVPFNELGDLNFRKIKGESNLPTELTEPAVSHVSQMTIKAVSALQKNDSKNAMSSVEEWLASTQKETPLADPYGIDEHSLKTKDIESSLYNAILKNKSDASDHHTDETRSLRPSDPEDKNNCLSATTLFPQSPLEYSMSAVPSTVPNCIPENISESLRQIPASSFGAPLASAPYSPFFSPGIQPLPVNSAAATSSILWQQAVMCANPLVMQQLHALQMFYISLGVPTPNTFIPAPPVLPSQQTLLPQNPFQGINFQLQQHSNNFNSLNLPSSAQYQAPLLPQFIPNSADANKAVNAPVQSLLSSSSISMDRPQEATPLPPPGINVDYFGPQSEEMASFMKLPDEFVSSHAAQNLVGDDGFVGIPPPKPAEKTTGSESIRRPRYKFNDLRPLLQQSNSNQSAQNYTVPKGNEQRF